MNKAIITNESKDNNPSPLEALDDKYKKSYIRLCNKQYEDEVERDCLLVQFRNLINEHNQALTNYANMVEKYDKALKYLCDNMDCPIELLKDDSYCSDNCGWKPTHSPCWDRYFEQNITKVLEGKINE
jgi:hypothetical protein